MFPYIKTGSESNISLYTLFSTIAICMYYIYNLFFFKKRKTMLSSISARLCNKKFEKAQDKKKTFSRYINLCTFFEIIIFSLLQYYPTVLFGKTLQVWIQDGTVNYYGGAYLFPFAFFAFCLILQAEPLKLLDLVTPGYALSLVFAKIACFCHGCCAGFETLKYGLYNHEHEKMMFPVQIVEAAVALLIFLFLFWYRKKAKTGTMYPIFLLLYSSTRFFTEFLRCEENLFGPLKGFHIYAIIGVALGLVELLVMLRFGKRISDLLSKKQTKLLDPVQFRKDKKLLRKKHK